MAVIAQSMFWISFSLLAYAFVGYPLILKILAAIGRKQSCFDCQYLSSVSIVLSVYNEEQVIGNKIDNFLSLDYPDHLLELVVVSDNCTDRTDEIVQQFVGKRVKLLVQNSRNGKTINLNRGVEAARGEVLVFTDANSMFDRDAVRNLVRHFADPEIGLVSGRSIYLDSNNSNEEIGGAYRDYEEMIKDAEGSIASIVGADGAIYALRSSLYEPLQSEYINDFIHTIQVVGKGYRAISDSNAICREVVSDTFDDELRRQTRIMAQSWLIFCSQIGGLISGLRFIYIWQLVSHKLIRWLTIPLLAIMVAATLVLFKFSLFYRLALIALAMFAVSALLGETAKHKVLRLPYMFMLLHYAAVLGFFRYLRGNTYTTWNPRNS